MRSLRFIAAASALAGSVLAQDSASSSATKPSFSPSTAKAFFVEQFTDDWRSRWSPSEATKDEKGGEGEVYSYVGQWEVEEPEVFPGINGDKGLVAKSKAAHHAISVPFPEALDPAGKPLVVQYEVKLQKGLECGGAYIKLLTESPDGIQAKEFSDKTPYTIMFGPDKCGSTSKVHFIVRSKNPISGAVEEKHLTPAPAPKLTKTTALYTLIVRPDQTYEIKVNDESVKTGSLLEDFQPPFTPLKEIDDPTDSKPADWVEEAKIPDVDAKKPDDWDEDAPFEVEDDDATIPEGWLVDEPATIPDPDAEKPEEWSDEEDGDFIPPSIPNPKCEAAPGCGPWTRPKKPNPAYKGKWYAPLIDNPLYKGIWAPKKIPNPEYYEEKTPANFNKIAGLGFEIWTMQEDILFDNIYIGQSEKDAADFAKATFHVKFPLEEVEEAKTKPAKLDEPTAIPEFAKDPVGFVRAKFQDFVDLAVVDPVAAVKAKPETAAGIAGAFIGFVGLLGALLGVLIPGGKAVAPAKKTDAKTADDKGKDDSKNAPIAGKAKETEAELRKRTAAKAE